MAYKINIDGFIGDAGFMGGDSFTLKDRQMERKMLVAKHPFFSNSND